MRYIFLLLITVSFSSFAQTANLKLTERDTLVTCGLTSREAVTGPLSDLHNSEFENLVAGVFKASRFPVGPYSAYRVSSPGYMYIGRQKNDELDYYTLFLYNLDSVTE